MQNDHSIAALHDNPGLQRRAQAAVFQAKTDWLQGETASLRAELTAYSNGASLADCAALSRLFAESSLANAVVQKLVEPMCRALNHSPLAQVPFRHQYQGGIGIARLVEAGDAALSLVIFEEGPHPPPQTICFTDSECVEVVLAGAGSVRVLRIAEEDRKKANIAAREQPLSRGTIVSVSGSNESRLIESVDGRLVALRLTRMSSQAQPSREFRLSDGWLVHRASGSRQHSRQEMALALLGAMARADAAPVLGDIALQADHPLRWEAIRQGLALDTATGFRKLDEVASAVSDPLSRTASALKGQLLETYPQLAQLEGQPCPA